MTVLSILKNHAADNELDYEKKNDGYSFVENKTKAQILVLILAVIIGANELLSLNPKVITIGMDINKFSHNGIYSLVSRIQHISFKAPAVIYFIEIILVNRKKMDGWLDYLYLFITLNTVYFYCGCF